MDLREVSTQIKFIESIVGSQRASDSRDSRRSSHPSLRRRSFAEEQRLVVRSSARSLEARSDAGLPRCWYPDADPGPDQRSRSTSVDSETKNALLGK